MAEKPVCSKCSKPHWRFVRCADADAQDEIEVAREKRRATLRVVPQWRTDKDREWGNRLPSYEHHTGTNVFWRRKDQDGPEAA